MTLLDLLPKSWRTPPVLKAEPAVTTPTVTAPVQLLRFSREEMNIAISVAWESGKMRLVEGDAHRAASNAVARFRREKNRLARKQSKPVPAPQTSTEGFPDGR